MSLVTIFRRRVPGTSGSEESAVFGRRNRAVETTAVRFAPLRQVKANCQFFETGYISSEVTPIKIAFGSLECSGKALCKLAARFSAISCCREASRVAGSTGMLFKNGNVESIFLMIVPNEWVELLAREVSDRDEIDCASFDPGRARLSGRDRRFRLPGRVSPDYEKGEQA